MKSFQSGRWRCDEGEPTRSYKFNIHGERRSGGDSKTRNGGDMRKPNRSGELTHRLSRSDTFVRAEGDKFEAIDLKLNIGAYENHL